METQHVSLQDNRDVSAYTRIQVLDALQVFAWQRPGIDPSNYITPGHWDPESVRAYRQEVREVTRDLSDARLLLVAVRGHESIGVQELIEATRAYSGRLQLRFKAGGVEVDYCTGQYWPTEYRRAVCAVLAAALWDWTRATVPPNPTHNGKPTTPGEWMRRRFRNEFGARIQKRWFD